MTAKNSMFRAMTDSERIFEQVEICKLNNIFCLVEKARNCLINMLGQAIRGSVSTLSIMETSPYKSDPRFPPNI